MTEILATSDIPTTTTEITFRPGLTTDSYAVFEVFEQSLADLVRRVGSVGPTSTLDPASLAEMWADRQDLYRHLAETAEHFWLAERDGQVVGYARSIQRDDVHELTEFFVRPEAQSAGVGRQLLARAFPNEGAPYRVIIATTDMRAQASYLKAGVYPRFPLYYFSREPETVTLPTDLTIEPIDGDRQNLAVIGGIDQAVLGHRRDIDHAWLLDDRQGYLYYRGQRPVGYGYTGLRNGPFALLDERDFPAVLAHAEREAVAQGRDHFGVEVPTINQTAVEYLVGRGFRLDSFVAIFMSNRPFGKFENYIVTSPPFFF